MSDEQRRMVRLIGDVARTPNWTVNDTGSHWLISGPAADGEPRPPYRVRRPKYATPAHLENITRALRDIGWTPQLAENARQLSRQLRLAASRVSSAA